MHAFEVTTAARYIIQGGIVGMVGYITQTNKEVAH